MQTFLKVLSRTNKFKLAPEIMVLCGTAQRGHRQESSSRGGGYPEGCLY